MISVFTFPKKQQISMMRQPTIMKWNSEIKKKNIRVKRSPEMINFRTGNEWMDQWWKKTLIDNIRFWIFTEKKNRLNLTFFSDILKIKILINRKIYFYHGKRSNNNATHHDHTVMILKIKKKKKNLISFSIDYDRWSRSS